jgi:hypothetical protein
MVEILVGKRETILRRRSIEREATPSALHAKSEDILGKKAMETDSFKYDSKVYLQSAVRSDGVISPTLHKDRCDSRGQDAA